MLETGSQDDDINPREMKVAELYRYPVKSLAPERLDAITITDDGRVLGDRVFAFRFATVRQTDPPQWLPKTNYASLQHIPELAKLASTYDPESGILSICDPAGGMSASGDPSIASDRATLSDALSEWYAQTESFSQTRRKGGFVLVGDGANGTHQYHDTKEGRTTLHSQASVDQIAGALELESLNGLRFRSNIVIEGCAPWAEFDWRGRLLQFGDGGPTMKVLKPVKRCLATHANPESGERDQDILNTLTRVIGQEVPQFAVSMTTASAGGEIRVGDPVTVLD